MAIGKAGGPNFQQQIQRAVARDVATVDTQEASHAAQTGGSNQLAEKAKSNKPKGPGEKLDPGLAARLKAAETEATKDAQSEARANVADEAAVQNRGKKDIKGGRDDDDKKVGAGAVKGKKDGTRVFALDDGDDGEVYEVSKSQAQNLDKLDDRSPESILKGMPEASRSAATATLDAQIKTKGKDKVSELKDDPKVSAVVEQMDLDPAEGFKEGVKIAPISTNTKPLAPEISPNDEVMAKEAAIKQMQSGGGEQMIA